jgi:hypothetical protein
MLWNDDLDEFMEKLQEVEEKEIADQAEGTDGKKAAKGKKKTFKQETMASPNGIRVAVKVSFSKKGENIYCREFCNRTCDLQPASKVQLISKANFLVLI